MHAFAFWRYTSRMLLCTLCVKVIQHAAYGTHSFRRGHAQVCSSHGLLCSQCALTLLQDMLAHGAELSQILRAGQWRSAAFLRYINEAELERVVALEVACETDDELWPEDID